MTTSAENQLRREAARQLTGLLNRHPAFSFVRLGDGEVKWMRLMQSQQHAGTYQYYDEAVTSVELVRGVTGMEPRHHDRFVAALENATFMDFCDSIPAVRLHLPDLNLRRPDSAHRNAGPQTSNIIFEWVFYELKDYLKTHRCLFAGAEAALLRELCGDPAYRKIAAKVLPDSGDFFFHQVRENGRNYSENLDLIKEDLKNDLQRHKADTLFLSLATGAKILCYELARELGIRAIDFGSMLRALTYAGSSGYQACRDMHNPFLFRVPMALFMPALERAHPDWSIVTLAAKAHAQAVLDLHRHEKFTFNTSHGIDGGRLDFSRENLRCFDESLRYYNAHYRVRARKDAVARRLDTGFRRWRLKNGIGLQGKIFTGAVKIKSELKKPAQLFRVPPSDHRMTPGRALYLFKTKFGHGLKAAWYRDVVRQTILAARAYPETDDRSCEIHVLTSAADWLNLIWALKSFYCFTGRRYALCIHDDGTLDAQACWQLQRAFPNARLVRRDEADPHMAALLASYPRCRRFRDQNKLALKVFDFIAYLKSERMLLLDSDILFFSKPVALLELVENPAVTFNTLNKDWQYGYSIDLGKTGAMLDFTCPPLINSGLGLVHKSSINFEWVDEFLGLPDILSHSHRIEQTLIALCSAKFGFKMLPQEYDVHAGPGNAAAPCRHYTGPIRHLMFSEGMRRLVKSGFLKPS